MTRIKNIIEGTQASVTPYIGANHLQRHNKLGDH